jgi:ferredoxin--NADP+ reductase
MVFVFNSCTSIDKPMKQIILHNDEIAPGVFWLAVERKHDFNPGQTVKVGLGDDLPPRIYSICSGNREDELRILFNIKEDGALTPQLARLKPGDEVWVSEPGGSFIGTADPAVWIATGTGIAPFYSMLRSGMAENQLLLHGVRHAEQFYFHEEWDAALNDDYHRFCSGEDVDGISSGRVNQYLELNDLPQDRTYFICGQATMCVEVRDLLIAKGIPFTHIVVEIYF